MKKKPRKRISIYLTYATVAFIFVVISAFIVLSATGYEIKFAEKELKLEKTGMIIISSKPSGANIYINGNKSDQKTNLIFSVKLDNIHEGKYTLRLSKEGFYTWEKEIEVFPEIVTWANYVLLFSKEPKIEKSIFTGSIRDTLVAEDKRHSAILTETKNGNSIYLLSNESGKYDKIFDTTTMPKKKKVKTIRLIELSKDGRTLLLSGTVERRARTFYLDMTAGEEHSLNVVSQPGLERMTFNDVADKEIFGIYGRELFRLSLATKNISSPLDREVVQAFSVDDQVFYIKDSKGRKSLWQMHSDTNGKKMICDDVPISAGYSFMMSAKDKNIALLTAEKKLYLLEKAGDKYVSREIGSKVSNFAWSPDGTRLFFQTNKTIFVLDLDAEKTYEIKNEGSYKGLLWYDSRHFLAQKGLNGVVMDFDGTNVVNLGKVIDGARVFFATGSKDIFFFSSSTKKTQFVLNRYQPEF